MRKTIFIGLLTIFTMSSTMSFAANNDSKAKTETAAVLAKTDTKLSAEDVAVLTKRVEEIRSMDKSNMTTAEKRELRKELKGIKSSANRGGEVIYLSLGTILLIILIIILI